MKSRKIFTVLLAFMTVVAMCFTLTDISPSYADEQDFDAIDVYLDDQLVSTMKLSDLEQIMAEEGNQKYTYSAYNRNVSYKNVKLPFETKGELTDIEGPTVKGILEASGIDADALDAKAQISFVGIDGVGHDFTKEQLFADRYYFPNGHDETGDALGYLAGGAFVPGTEAGAVPVPAIISLVKEVKLTNGYYVTGDDLLSRNRLVFGQTVPNEQNYTVFTKYMIDIEDREVPSQIRVNTAKAGAFKTVTGASVKNKSTVNVGREISFKVPAAYDMNTFPLVVYTTDGSEPTMASEKFNYKKNGVMSGQMRPAVITKPGTVYVKARIVGYGKTDSAVKTFKYTAKVAKPSGFSAAKKDYRSNQVSWNTNGYMTGYKVYRAKGTSKKFTLIADVTDFTGDTYTYVDEDVVTGTQYKYKVRAYVTADGKTTNGAYTAVKKAKPALDKPAIEDLSQPEGGQAVDIQWSCIDGADGYVLQKSTSKKKGYKKAAELTGNEEVLYQDTAVKAGKTYYYKVRAYINVNGKKVYSSYSAVKNIRVK